MQRKKNVVRGISTVCIQGIVETNIFGHFGPSSGRCHTKVALFLLGAGYPFFNSFFTSKIRRGETFFSKGKQIQSTKRILSYAEGDALGSLRETLFSLSSPLHNHKKASGSYASTRSKWKSGIPAHAIYMWLLPISLLPHKILSMFFRSYIGGPLFQSGADERRRCISICLGPKKKSLLLPALNGKRGRRG